MKYTVIINLRLFGAKPIVIDFFILSYFCAFSMIIF